MGLALDVVVAEVGGEVHAEADAHDEVDEGDPVQHDAPQGHEAQGSLFLKEFLIRILLKKCTFRGITHKPQGSLFLKEFFKTNFVN